MTYKETIQQIYDLQEFAIKLGLENISALANRLGNPHLKYPVIHIAGTNGKGSTAFFIHQLLQHHGLKSGMFTSPHLTDYRERIRVGDELISPYYVIDFWRHNKDYILKRKATFFDTTTALAFQYFADQKVDVAVIETGLGGRLDSTNIVQPEIVVLTPVDFDHQKQLGNTLSSIAREKAGIIKPGATVFCAPQPPDVLNVFLKHVENLRKFRYLPDLIKIKPGHSSLDGQNLKIYFISEQQEMDFKSLQCGHFQAQNQALALLVVNDFLRKKQLNWDPQAIQQVFSTRLWPGRLQTVHLKPRIIFDVSHNLAGIKGTLEFVKKNIAENKIYLLIGLLEYKDYKNIVTFLSKQNLNIYLTEPKTEKKLPAVKLKTAFKQLNKETSLLPDPVKAVKLLKTQLTDDELLIVMGSHYLIGYLMNQLKTDLDLKL